VPEPRQSAGVLYVSSVSQLGGAEHSLLELMTHLDPQTYAPRLLVSEDGPLPQRFRDAGGAVFFGEFPWFSKKRPWVYARAIWRIVSLVRKHGVRLIHVNCDRAVPHAVLAARLAGVPCVCHIRDMLRSWYLPAYVRHLNRAAAIIANSQATAAKCRSAGMNPSRLHVIHVGLPMDRFTSTTSLERAAFRREYHIEGSHVAIGLVGHILEHKGHEDFVHAVSIVQQRCPTARFFVVGDDAMSDDRTFLPRLRVLVEETGLTERFVFTGARSDIPRVMSGLDVVVAPSWNEPFGRVVVEAMAAGRAVVGSRAGGIPEIVEDGVSGLLCPPRDPPALADQLIRLCEDAPLRAQLGAQARPAAARFDIAQHVRTMSALYDSLLHRPAAEYSSASAAGTDAA